MCCGEGKVCVSWGWWGAVLWFLLAEREVSQLERVIYILPSCHVYVWLGQDGVGWNGSVVGGMMSRWVEMSQSRVAGWMGGPGWGGIE